METAASAPDSLHELEAALQRAEAKLAAVRPTAEQLRAEAAEVERQAQLNGTNAKTSAVVQSMRRRRLLPTRQEPIPWPGMQGRGPRNDAM